MTISEKQLKQIAKIAYINVDRETTTHLVDDVRTIIHFVEQLQDVDTKDVKPLMHPLDIHQRLRPDEVQEENRHHQLNKIAPLFAEGLYLVPKVIQSEK